nr:hypothetical protein [Tolivirales sp.]
MAAIIRGNVQRVAVDLVDVAPPEFQPNIFRRFWTATKLAIGEMALIQWCCGAGEDDHFYEYDREVRSKISRCLVVRNQGAALNDVVETMREVYETTGYDLGHAAHCVRTHVGVPMTNRERARARIIDTIPRAAPQVEHTVTKVVPLFAASMVAHLRAKLGRLPKSEANYLVLQREYLRKCKLHHVRDVDVLAHEQHVINAFFGDETFDRVGFGKVRASRFRKWVNSDVDRQPAPQIC